MNEIISTIKKYVPNVNEYFNDDELRQIYSEYDDWFSKCETPEDIVSTFASIIHNWDDGDYRICSECGNIMCEGYCVNQGDYYYCSNECLHKHFTEEEWQQECEENDQSYYTEWY